MCLFVHQNAATLVTVVRSWQDSSLKLPS